MNMSIFDYEFMRNAFVAGALVGVVCPVVGLFIVLRRLSMIADALSHVCLSGIAAALLTGANPVVSAAVFSMSGAFLIEALRERYRNYSELSIAIVLSAGVAVGAILLSLGRGLSANFMSYLFGSIVTINRSDIIMIASGSLFILLVVWAFYKELFLITFDEEGAIVAGLPVRGIAFGFTAMTALAIALSISIVGILLVSSLMVLPVAGALRVSGSFRQAFAMAVLLGEFSVITGLFLSFYFNLAPGGAIIMIAILALIACLAYASLRPVAGAGEA